MIDFDTCPMRPATSTSWCTRRSVSGPTRACSHQESHEAKGGGGAPFSYIVYAPNETALAYAAVKRVLVAATVLFDVVYQAAAADELWFRSRAPLDVMRAAAGRAAGRLQ